MNKEIHISNDVNVLTVAFRQLVSRVEALEARAQASEDTAEATKSSASVPKKKH